MIYTISIYTASKKIGFLLFLLLLLNGCSIKQNVNDIPSQIQTGTEIGINLSNFDIVSQETIKSLKEKDMEKLSQTIGENGVIFSPYNNINTGDKNFGKDEIKNLLLNTQVFNRGNYDGSGEPVNLSFKDYFDKFVYDADFANAPEKIENQIVQRGNIINNIKEFYPNSQTIEYYFSGFDQQYEGMDRKSLTLIFNKIGNNRYLVGISHGQRTI